MTPRTLAAFESRRELAACIVLSVLLALIGLVPALTVGIILDRVIQTRAFATLLAVLLAYGLFFVCELVFTYIQDRLLLHVTHAGVVQAEMRFWGVLRDAPYAELERLRDDEGLARFLSIGNDVRFRADWAVSVASIPLCLAIALTALFLVSTRLTLLVFALTGVFMIAHAGLTRIQRRMASELQRTRERELAQVQDMLQGAPSLKAHRAFDFGLRRWQLAKEAYEHALHRWSEASVVQNLVGLSFERLALGLLLGVGAHEVVLGQLSVGQLVMANMLLRQVSLQVRQVAPLLQRRTAFRASQAKMVSFLSRKQPAAVSGPDLPLRPQAALEVEDVSFRSPDGRLILDRISFTLPPGQSLAILGASGAGKTTLLKILSGLYAPAGGCVRVHGMAPARRTDLAYLSQQEHMFAGGIAENVLLGRTTEPIALEALGPLELDRVIAAPAPDTETCAQLSGGERQRVFVARAMAHGRAGLFLDEPTTALDDRRRDRLLELLRHAAAQRQVMVFATHDSDLAAIADHTLHLDGRGKGHFCAGGHCSSLTRQPP